MLKIDDLHQEQELSRSEMSKVSGGALVDVYGVSKWAQETAKTSKGVDPGAATAVGLALGILGIIL